MDYNAENIFKKLKTKDRVNKFLLFSSVFQSFDNYVGGVDFDSVLGEKFGETIPDWLVDIKNNILGVDFDKFDKEKALETLEKVENMIKGSEVVKVEISFEPSEGFVDALISLLGAGFNYSGNPEKNILVDIDLKDIGEPGAMIYIGGKFIDLTLKKQVVNYLMSNDVINRYL